MATSKLSESLQFGSPRLILRVTFTGSNSLGRKRPPIHLKQSS